MALSAGTRLGPYEILAPLGAGGMGEVYRARDKKLDRNVAIKVLPESVAADPETLARFEREAKAVAALSHPNILSIFDFGTQDGVSYAVMELLEGETLRGKLDARSRLPEAGRQLRPPDRQGPLGGAREGDRPPRPEAGEPLRHRGRPPEDPRLRSRQEDGAGQDRRDERADRVEAHRAGHRSWGRSATCRPSRCADCPSTTARTSSLSGRSSTSCSRGRKRSRGTRPPTRCRRS